MKLKYKKLIIIISIGVLFLGFLILTLIPTGGDTVNPVEQAELEKTEDQNVDNLITSYFQAKRDVDMETMESLVSDINQVDQEKLIAQAAYVEDYQNISCLTLKNEDNDALRVYVRYDMKLKNIETLAPSLSALYITLGSDGKYLIYLSALDEAEEDFILAADQNAHVVELQNEVANKFQEAINADGSLSQLYQQMEQELQAAQNAANESGAVDKSTSGE